MGGGGEMERDTMDRMDKRWRLGRLVVLGLRDDRWIDRILDGIMQIDGAGISLCEKNAHSIRHLRLAKSIWQASKFVAVAAGDGGGADGALKWR